jgi:hypothetical protein
MTPGCGECGTSDGIGKVAPPGGRHAADAPEGGVIDDGFAPCGKTRVPLDGWGGRATCGPEPPGHWPGANDEPLADGGGVGTNDGAPG